MHTNKILARKWDVLEDRFVVADQDDLEVLIYRLSRIVSFAYLGSPIASERWEESLGFSLQKRRETFPHLQGLCSWSLEMRYRF